jgi:hypothetical protein
VRRLLLISLLAVVAAALVAPVPAQAQSEQDVECAIDAILPDFGVAIVDDPTTAVDEADKALQAAIARAEECLGNFLPGLDRDFCSDCDPTFDFEEIRQVIIRFDRGRALRQRLLECRDRRLNKTQSEDSARDCRGLEAIFELYINDEASLEARRRSDARPIGSDPAPEPDPATAARRGLAFRAPSPQRARRGLRFTCRPPQGGLCRVEVLARGVLVARGARAVPAGATATLRLRPTRRGSALIARRGRVRAKVLGRVPGAFTIRTVTLTR